MRGSFKLRNVTGGQGPALQLESAFAGLGQAALVAGMGCHKVSFSEHVAGNEGDHSFGEAPLTEPIATGAVMVNDAEVGVKIPAEQMSDVVE